MGKVAVGGHESVDALGLGMLQKETRASSCVMLDALSGAAFGALPLSMSRSTVVKCPEAYIRKAPEG